MKDKNNFFEWFVGIAGIGLDYETMNETDGQGNAHTQKSYYVREDGTTALVEDVWFDRDLSDTVAAEYLEETEEIRKLPDILGKGKQYSLHQAMLQDERRNRQSVQEIGCLNKWNLYVI